MGTIESSLTKEQLGNIILSLANVTPAATGAHDHEAVRQAHANLIRFYESLTVKIP